MQVRWILPQFWTPVRHMYNSSPPLRPTAVVRGRKYVMIDIWNASHVEKHVRNVKQEQLFKNFRNHLPLTLSFAPAVHSNISATCAVWRLSLGVSTGLVLLCMHVCSHVNRNM